jgi:hypothetical protein
MPRSWPDSVVLHSHGGNLARFDPAPGQICMDGLLGRLRRPPDSRSGGPLAWTRHQEQAIPCLPVHGCIIDQRDRTGVRNVAILFMTRGRSHRTLWSIVRRRWKRPSRSVDNRPSAVEAPSAQTTTSCDGVGNPTTTSCGLPLDVPRPAGVSFLGRPIHTETPDQLPTGRIHRSVSSPQGRIG